MGDKFVMDTQELWKLLDKRFESMEGSHKEQTKKLDDIASNVTTLATYRETDKLKIDDHETRIRSNEQSKYKLIAGVTGLSTLGSGSIVAAINKIFGAE